MNLNLENPKADRLQNFEITWTDRKSVLTVRKLWEVISELPRHNSFSYINSRSLTDVYFKSAQKSLDDGYLYLTIAGTKSSAGDLIGLFTHRRYNHVSLSFDRNMDTLVSYNGGERKRMPGLNPESLTQLAENTGASVMIYRLAATREQKWTILNRIYEINEEGSAYNLLGLVSKSSRRPNIMFCSQFVYTMLKLAGLQYFEKEAADVRPTDFVELDYFRNLEFVEIISL